MLYSFFESSSLNPVKGLPQPIGGGTHLSCLIESLLSKPNVLVNSPSIASAFLVGVAIIRRAQLRLQEHAQ